MSIHDTLTNNFRITTSNRAMKPSSNYANFIVYPYAYFLRPSVSLVLSYTSGFISSALSDMLHYWISYAKYLSNILLNESFPWHIPSLGFSIKTKRRRSDPVLWQKPLHQQKCQKGKVTTQITPQKSSIKQQLWTDLGRSVGVTTATQLVWFTGFTGPTFPL